MGEGILYKGIGGSPKGRTVGGERLGWVRRR